LTGGGVTAGSAVSSPSVFFVNKVVAISAGSLISFRPPNKSPVRPSNTPGNGPNADLCRARRAQHPGTSTGCGARGKHIVNENNALTVQLPAASHRKSIAHVGLTLRAAQQCLGAGRLGSPQQAPVQGHTACPAETPG